jgi:hypothetical protein
MSSDMTCDLTLAPSRIAVAFVLAATLATIVLLVELPGPAELRAAAILWCMGAGAHAFKRHRAAHRVHTDGGAMTVDGIEGRIVDGSFVAPWLTIIHWRPAGSRLTRTLVVLPDAIDPEPFRALRVILRWPTPGGPLR